MIQLRVPTTGRRTTDLLDSALIITLNTCFYANISAWHHSVIGSITWVHKCTLIVLIPVVFWWNVLVPASVFHSNFYLRSPECGFCSCYCIRDGIRALGWRATKAELRTKKGVVARSYKRRRAPYACGLCFDTLLQSVPYESRCCKGWCLLFDVWLVENISWAVLPLARRISPVGTSRCNALFLLTH